MRPTETRTARKNSSFFFTRMPLHISTAAGPEPAIVCSWRWTSASVPAVSPEGRSIHHSWPPGPIRWMAITASAIGGRCTSPPCEPVAMTPAIDCPPLPPRVSSALAPALHCRSVSPGWTPVAPGGSSASPCRMRLTLKTLVPPLTWTRFPASEGSARVSRSTISVLGMTPVIASLSISTALQAKLPMNDHRLPVHFTLCPASSACLMISTISPRVEGRKDFAAVKVSARAQLVNVFGAVSGVERMLPGQIMASFPPEGEPPGDASGTRMHAEFPSGHSIEACAARQRGRPDELCRENPRYVPSRQVRSKPAPHAREPGLALARQTLGAVVVLELREAGRGHEAPPRVQVVVRAVA